MQYLMRLLPSLIIRLVIPTELNVFRMFVKDASPLNVTLVSGNCA